MASPRRIMDIEGKWIGRAKLRFLFLGPCGGDGRSESNSRDRSRTLLSGRDGEFAAGSASDVSGLVREC